MSASISDQISSLFNNEQCLSSSDLLHGNQTGLIVLGVAAVGPLILFQVITLLGFVCWRVESLRQQGLRGFLWRLGPCIFSRRKKSKTELIEEERQYLAAREQEEAEIRQYAGTEILSALIREQETAAAAAAEVSPPPPPLTTEALKQASTPRSAKRRKGQRAPKTGQRGSVGPFAKAQDDLLRDRRAARLELLNVPPDSAQPNRDTLTDADVGAQEAVGLSKKRSVAPPRTPINSHTPSASVPQWTVEAPSEDNRSTAHEETDIIESYGEDQAQTKSPVPSGLHQRPDW